MPTWDKLNLILWQRLHWKRASRSNPGLMLTSPLRHAQNTDEKLIKVHNSSIPLLRPQDLR